ncbi:MAG TPA: VWA domain-containing protein [Bryobacteraceae bacterium]|nr:VWA domain-containing protein [Bryobacteraceae bacterium]
MRFWICFSLLAAAGCAGAADNDTPVFHSDVSVGRIDALVLDGAQFPIGDLGKEDFALRQDGKTIPIREVGFESLPVDVLLLLDVSGSMQVHVQRVADAAHGALAVLGNQDRVGIMAFDTHTRLRLPFKEDLSEVERKLDDVVRSESFHGGTNINGALMDAAAYMEREERRQARHAIVIVTDDQARPCDQVRVQAALDKADAVLMVLLAPAWDGPYSTGPTSRRGGGPMSGQPPLSGPWPGGGGIGGLGGVIWGPRRMPAPGAPPVTVGNSMAGLHAGTPEIARASGGDSLSIDDADALATTFERIRKRYAIYYHLPEGMDAGRSLELDLTDAARRRHRDASLQYRQITLAKDGARPGLISRVPAHPPLGRDPEPAQTDSARADSDAGSPTVAHRRPGVSDSSGTQVTLPVQASTDPAAGASAPPVRRRPAVSDPGSGPRVTIGPSQ